MAGQWEARCAQGMPASPYPEYELIRQSFVFLFIRPASAYSDYELIRTSLILVFIHAPPVRAMESRSAARSNLGNLALQKIHIISRHSVLVFMRLAGRWEARCAPGKPASPYSDDELIITSFVFVFIHDELIRNSFEFLFIRALPVRARESLSEARFAPGKPPPPPGRPRASRTEGSRPCTPCHTQEEER